ncbi:MAG: DUF3592 domain-containing protein [Anaerolineales bacterium]|nr:DUF3592 domain-containing protein [Anaerolineales bacterium]
MKRIWFVLRSVVEILLLLTFLIVGITALSQFFGTAAFAILVLLLAVLGYGYLKIREKIRLWKNPNLRAAFQDKEQEPSVYTKSSKTLPEKFRQLDIPYPQSPFRNSLFWAPFWIVVEVVFVLILVVFFGFNREWMLLFESESAQANLIEVSYQDSHVVYQFQALVNGEYQKITDIQDVAQPFSYSVGDQVTVQYLPSDPSVAVLEGHFPLSIVGGYLALGISIPIIVLFLVPSLLRNINKAYLWFRLQREGQIVPALIVWQDKYKQRSETAEGTYESDVYEIAFAFEVLIPEQGRKIFVRAEKTSARVYGATQVGKWITVRYLPQNPAVCEIASLSN